MASTDSTAMSSKKRNIFFGHLLATKNLSIFRSRSPIMDNPIEISKDSKLYKSQLNINCEQKSIPICISRGWLKKRSQRPISLDLDLVKDLLINNDGHLIELQQRQKQIGITYLSI